MARWPVASLPVLNWNARVFILDHSEQNILKQIKDGKTLGEINPYYQWPIDKEIMALKEQGLIEFYLDTPFQPLSGPKMRLTPEGENKLKESLEKEEWI